MVSGTPSGTLDCYRWYMEPQSGTSDTWNPMWNPRLVLVASGTPAPPGRGWGPHTVILKLPVQRGSHNSVSRDHDDKVAFKAWYHGCLAVLPLITRDDVRQHPAGEMALQVKEFFWRMIVSAIT